MFLEHSVFCHTKRDGNIPTGTPPPTELGRLMQGGIKIMIFDQYLALSRKRCKIELNDPE